MAVNNVNNVDSFPVFNLDLKAVVSSSDSTVCCSIETKDTGHYNGIKSLGQPLSKRLEG